MTSDSPATEPALPAPETQRRWRPAERWSLAVRIALLTVLLSGLVATLLQQEAGYRRQGVLLDELAAGRVTFVKYDSFTHEVLWTGNWWSWQRTTLDTWGDATRTDPAQTTRNPAPGIGDPAAGVGDGAPGASPEQAASAWLQWRIAASPRHVRFDEPVDQQGFRLGWAASWPPLGEAVAMVSLLAFVLMLARTEHRYANRWAWFWILIVGQVGGQLYLVLEPFPLWRRPWRPGREHVRIGGAAGLAYGILLSVVAGVVVVILDAVL